MSQFTPGPWKAERHTIYTLRPFDVNDAIAVATRPEDARLIAEAPAMLELIKQGLDADARWDQRCVCNLCVTARQIIKRIEGTQNDH